MTKSNSRHRGGSADRRPKAAHDVSTLVDDVLRRATEARASDVHFEPTARRLLVKFRLDGTLVPTEELPKALAENVVSRLKVLGGLLTYRNDIPQEGRIAAREDASEVMDCRLAVFPTVHGQRAVVRLFYEDNALAELAALGLRASIHSALVRIAEGSEGVLLVTGPAGSGKSTTLAALLRHVVRRFGGKSVVTLEDPVERRIDGVTQVEITPHGRMTFPTALRSLLRQDPEVLMIGEIRDAETARIAIEAGLTGHLLMTTMHSGTPAGALLRLLEMGIEPYQVTSSVSGVLNQRLVRRRCAACGSAGNGSDAPVPPGCEACFGTGYRGRALIAEMVVMDGELRQAVLKKADLESLTTILRRRGHMGLRQSGMELVRRGVTTRQEVDRICGPGAEGQE